MLSMSDVQRIDGWKTALRALRAHPGRALTFGWGPETFQPVYRLYRTQASADLIGYDKVADHAHNLPLELLVTLGAIGTAAFVYFAWRLWMEADTEGRAALLGMAVMALVEPVFFPAAALLFLLLGARREDLHAAPAPRLAAGALVVVAAIVWGMDRSARSLFLHPHQSEANQFAVMAAIQRGDGEAALVYAKRAAAADPRHTPMIAQVAELEAAVIKARR